MFCQIYLFDIASITMKGILIFNKHLLFLLTVIVLIVGWLLFYTVYYFRESSFLMEKLSPEEKKR